MRSRYKRQLIRLNMKTKWPTRTGMGDSRPIFFYKRFSYNENALYRSPVFYVFLNLMLEGCRLGSRPLPVVRHASWWLTVRRRGGHNGGERQRGQPRLQWRLLTHPRLALDGQRRPPRLLRSSLFHLRMTDAPLSVNCKKSTTDRGKPAASDQRRGGDLDGQTEPAVEVTCSN